MYEQVIAINVGLAMLLAMSLNIITGFAGQPTLGHAAFYGIGAYTSALLTAKAGWPFFLALLTCIALLLAFPQIVLFLPNLMK